MKYIIKNLAGSSCVFVLYILIVILYFISKCYIRKISYFVKGNIDVCYFRMANYDTVACINGNELLIFEKI